MAFVEFETPQEAVKAMERDRAKFGPEYGDRYCMLQLVGRHEMDKVQLQRENDAGSKLLVRGVACDGALRCFLVFLVGYKAEEGFFRARPCARWLRHASLGCGWG